MITDRLVQLFEQYCQLMKELQTQNKEGNLDNAGRLWTQLMETKAEMENFGRGVDGGNQEC